MNAALPTFGARCLLMSFSTCEATSSLKLDGLFTRIYVGHSPARYQGKLMMPYSIQRSSRLQFRLIFYSATQASPSLFSCQQFEYASLEKPHLQTKFDISCVPSLNFRRKS
jgi:hypothetical protein